MPTNSVDSRLMNFGELFTGNTHYIVPHFQRDYSWTEIQVDELWTDIVNTIDEDRPEHFVGAVVVNTAEKPSLRLIDGQQRITTISLLMCAIRDIAREQSDEELSILISESYLGSRNLRTRKTDPKLTLNETNNQFYRENFLESKDVDFLEKLRKALRKKARENQEKSNQLMLEAYLLLYRKVQERISNKENFAEALIQIEECIRERLVAILISVVDEANSYLIFETLNNRGLDLSGSDLLKNHLFAKAGNDFADVQKKWSYVQSNVDKYEVTRFIRYYWISKYRVVSEKELFRDISSKFRTSSSVIDFMNALSDASEIFGALKNPQSSFWDSFPPSVRQDVSRLMLFNTTQCYSVLLAAKEELSDQIFAKVLRMIVVFSFRYSTICGLNPNRLESIYSGISRYIRNENPKSASLIFEKLKSIYPKDQDFLDAFQKKIISAKDSALARYILSEINSHYMGSKELVANPNESELNLEHILPQKPNENWRSKFTKTDPELYIYRLGNMTLLDASTNRKVGNGSFQDKCSKAYSNSKLEITREIADSSSIWGPKQIEKRQSEMSKVACHIWRLDY